MTDRYEHLARHADAGLGSAELGLRRFTRWADYIEELDGIAHKVRLIADDLADDDQGIERQSITESANTIVGRLERLADHLEARTVLANGSGPSASDQEPG